MNGTWLFRQSWWTLCWAITLKTSCLLQLVAKRYQRCFIKSHVWGRKWQPTLVFLPGKSHRQRSLEGYSPKSCKESDKLRQLSTRMLITSARPPLPWIFPHLAKESFFPSIFPEIPPYSPHFSWLTGHKVIFPTSTLIKHAAPHDSPSP